MHSLVALLFACASSAQIVIVQSLTSTAIQSYETSLGLNDASDTEPVTTSPQSSLLWPMSLSRYIWASSMVTRDLLYIDGGELYTDDYDGSVSFASTLAIDLTHSWSTSTVKALAADKPTVFPYGRQPYIWAQDTTQDSFTVNYAGGWPYGNQVGWFSGAGTYGSANASAALSQWQLNVSSNAVAQWTNSAVQPNQESTGQISLNAGTLHTSSNDSAFALGGAIIGYNPDENAVAVGLTGMAVQDLTTGRWQNISTTSTLYGANGFGAFGEAVFLPGYGDQGVLAFVGGYAPNRQFFTWSDVSQDSLQDLSRIFMYDIASQTFFAQPVTGAQIPGPRWGFCAVGVEDANGSGFDIFMHGGYYGGQSPVDFESGYDNIWVLSIPSFQWLKINGSTQTMRALHTCEVIGESQMIVIGGDNPNATGYGDTKDPWSNNLGIFDLLSLSWTQAYNASRGPYVRSDKLTSMIGNNAFPSTGASQIASDIFTQSNDGVDTNSTNSDNVNGNNNKSTPVGAIAGGVVGGVVALAVIAALLWFFVVKPRRHKYERSPSEEASGKAELPADSKYGFVQADAKEMGQLEGDEPKRAELEALRQHAELESPHEVYEMQGSRVSVDQARARRDEAEA